MFCSMEAELNLVCHGRLCPSCRHSKLRVVVLTLTPYLGGLQVLGSMEIAMDQIRQASTALAASVRQAAGWLGHASAQSASPAKLQQVCLTLWLDPFRHTSIISCHISAVQDQWPFSDHGNHCSKLLLERSSRCIWPAFLDTTHHIMFWQPANQIDLYTWVVGL